MIKKISGFGLIGKFIIIVFLPILIMSTEMSYIFIINSLKQIKTTMVERGKSTARVFSRSSEYGLLIENNDILYEVISKYTTEKDIIYLLIKNVSGDIIVHYGDVAEFTPDSAKTYTSSQDEKEKSQDLECTVMETDSVFDFTCNVEYTREKKSREEIGLLQTDTKTETELNVAKKIGNIQMGLSKTDMINSIRKTTIKAVSIVSFITLATVLVTLLLVSFMLTPIRRLASASERVAKGDFDHPVSTNSRDEIGILAKSFNQMMVDLKKSRFELQYRLDIEKIVTAISTDFINVSSNEVDNEINRTLQRISELVDSDKTFVFLLSRDWETINKTYEWSKEGLIAQFHWFEGMKVEKIKWWIDKLKQSENVYIPRIADIPNEAIADVNTAWQDIQSLVIVPMLYGRSLIGCLGFSSIQIDKAWMQEDITLLKMVGEIFVNALERKTAEEAIHHQLEVEERMTKELEEKTKELSLSNEELNSFVYIVSHDLKAPLVSIQGFSTILSKDYKDQFDDNGKIYVDRIMKNSERMGMLIDNLLELSRIGRIKGKEGTINISNMISEISEEISSQMQEKGTKLIVKGEMPTISGDQTRVKQIFANLISNANKFMGDDNEVPTIEVGYDSQNGCHRFYVKDNGIGIDKQYHSKVFQIFQRLDDIKTEGTGVGLAIVKKIVENFGGKIWLDSEKGKGTTMYFTIPKENNRESKKEE
ncbi:MAG: hypothetical protein QG588_272 [Candidatus Poribacteria bacterium]|nr:hypothetical protein [Candidatus Poribacteria bacterium]